MTQQYGAQAFDEAQKLFRRNLNIDQQSRLTHICRRRGTIVAVQQILHLVEGCQNGSQRHRLTSLGAVSLTEFGWKPI
jgi:hypothetical protein